MSIPTFHPPTHTHTHSLDPEQPPLRSIDSFDRAGLCSALPRAMRRGHPWGQHGEDSIVAMKVSVSAVSKSVDSVDRFNINLIPEPPIDQTKLQRSGSASPGARRPRGWRRSSPASTRARRPAWECGTWPRALRRSSCWRVGWYVVVVGVVVLGCVGWGCEEMGVCGPVGFVRKRQMNPTCTPLPTQHQHQHQTKKPRAAGGRRQGEPPPAGEDADGHGTGPPRAGGRLR